MSHTSRGSQHRFYGVLGNFLDHYDSALFGLLAPVLAPIFFDSRDPISALGFAFLMLPIGCIARPLGAFVFGYLADLKGRRFALFLSLAGMGIATASIGLIPTFHEAGSIASIYLALVRVCQGFFSAGEAVIGAVFVLEQTKSAKRGFAGGFYDASTIGGVLFASLLIALLQNGGAIEESWRWLFWAGAFASVVGVWIRYTESNSRIGEWQGGSSNFSTIASGSAREHAASEAEQFEAKPTPPKSILESRAVYTESNSRTGDEIQAAQSNTQRSVESAFAAAPKRPISWVDAVRGQGGAFGSLILAFGFSYTTYYFAFSFLNGYLPLISSYSPQNILSMTPWLLGADLVFLLIFGYLSDRWGRTLLMQSAACAAVCLGTPLFYCFSLDSMAMVWLGRLTMVAIGTAFAAPLYAEAFEKLSRSSRCTLLALSCSLGSGWIGAPAAAASLWFYQLTKWPLAPGLYLAICGIFGFLSIFYLNKKQSVPNIG